MRTLIQLLDIFIQITVEGIFLANKREFCRVIVNFFPPPHLEDLIVFNRIYSLDLIDLIKPYCEWNTEILSFLDRCRNFKIVRLWERAGCIDLWLMSFL